MSIPRKALFACLMSLVLPSAASAKEQHIYAYDPSSPSAKALTDTGLSFEFERGLLGGIRIERIIQTGEFGEAQLKPVSEADLGRGGLRAALGAVRPVGPIYEILPKEEGRSFVHAVCPGAERAWLLIGRLDRFRDLTVQAVGRKAGQASAYACPTLDFNFRSELRMPGHDVPGAYIPPGLSGG
jgi:hypothetical protein